jgi:hypothetical protein
MQKTLEAALACVLQSAGHSCVIVADEYGRLFQMGAFEDVCGVHELCHDGIASFVCSSSSHAYALLSTSLPI